MPFPEITPDAPLGWAQVLPESVFGWPCDDGSRVPSRKLCPEFDASGYTGDYSYPDGYKVYENQLSGYRYILYTPGLFGFLKHPLINTQEAILRIGGDGKPTGLSVVNKGLFNAKPNVVRGFVDGQPIPDPPWEQNPKGEMLTSPGAVHLILEIGTNSVKLQTFTLSETAPDPVIYNPTTTPWLFYPFMAVDDKGNLSYNTGVKNNVPFVSLWDGAWIQKERVKILDKYPQPEEPTMGTYLNAKGESITNQDMINVFYAAASALGMNGWTLITKAGLTGMADSEAVRAQPYTGPLVEDLPLAVVEVAALQDQMTVREYVAAEPAPPPNADLQAAVTDLDEAIVYIEEAKQKIQRVIDGG